MRNLRIDFSCKWLEVRECHQGICSSPQCLAEDKIVLGPTHLHPPSWVMLLSSTFSLSPFLLSPYLGRGPIAFKMWAPGKTSCCPWLAERLMAKIKVILFNGRDDRSRGPEESPSWVSRKGKWQGCLGTTSWVSFPVLHGWWVNSLSCKWGRRELDVRLPRISDVIFMILILL